MNEAAIRNLKKNLVGLLILGVILVGVIVWWVVEILTFDGAPAARGAMGFVYEMLAIYLILPGSVIAAIYAIICTKKMARTGLQNRRAYVGVGITAAVINFLPLAAFLVGVVCLLVMAI